MTEQPMPPHDHPYHDSASSPPSPANRQTGKPRGPHGRARTGSVIAAIAGNPNSGKTSIFNNLTGMTQSVANYPGVTVERKTGHASHGGREVTLVDLPGTYSLTAYSLDELIARDFVIESKPDVVVNVVSAANLERNLYLTVQLMEMQRPLVIALNMSDLARRQGIRIDTAKMSVLLGAPVIETVGNRGIGLGALIEATADTALGPATQAVRPVSYGHEVETEVEKVAEVVAREEALVRRYPARWVAVKLIEGDKQILKKVRQLASDAAAIESATQTAIAAIESHFGESAEIIIAERRYGFVAGIVRECVRSTAESRQNLTDTIDSVVCHRIFGPAFVLAVVYSLFAAIFKVADEWKWLFGKSPTDWVKWLFDDVLAGLVAGLEPDMPLLHSLLHDGVIGGVGGVLAFVPLIATLFAFVAVLEDTGYVARVAFVLDRLLRVFGLQGKSMLAMIVGGGLGAGGCAVPAVMATRTLREEKDRLVTMLVVPLMNCGAKIPVYLMLIAAFFASHKPQILFSLWAASWAIALGAAWVLRKTVFRGEQTPFVMELPAYHMPTLRGVLTHTWERVWQYIRKAGTVILAVNLLIWAAMSFPRLNTADGADQLRHSIAGRIGSAMEPVTRYAGFDSRDNIALIGGFAAKEVVVGTMGIIHAKDDSSARRAEGLSAKLAADPSWSAARALALMVFVMIYSPCSATLMVIRRESGKWRWALFAMVYTTVLAFIVAATVYQIGRLIG
ncbi:MAG: ferrous iron transport protein B [Phycisphaerae bacterium]|nr:ferrous iron transport protein B [Phycisphaerae bacterium]